MDLKRYVEAKRALERNLMVMIQAELRKFEEVTGQCPRDVRLRMIQVKKFGEPIEKYLVGAVQVDVPAG